MKKGSQVCREGEPSEALFVVNSGLIKLTKNSKEGKQHIVRFLFFQGITSDSLPCCIIKK
ncbi:cyclic nucleotide-binding domain-containing protein [Paenibacillus rhizoplanae]